MKRRRRNWSAFFRRVFARPTASIEPAFNVGGSALKVQRLVIKGSGLRRLTTAATRQGAGRMPALPGFDNGGYEARCRRSGSDVIEHSTFNVEHRRWHVTPVLRRKWFIPDNPHLAAPSNDSLAPAHSARSGPSPSANSFHRFPKRFKSRSRERGNNAERENPKLFLLQSRLGGGLQGVELRT